MTETLGQPSVQPSVTAQQAGEAPPYPEEKPSGPLIFLVIVGMIIMVGLASGGYFFYWLPQKTSLASPSPASQMLLVSPSPASPSGQLSTSDDPDTLKKETDQILIDDFSPDLEQIGKEIEGL